jgi:conjugative transposon TraN protein
MKNLALFVFFFGVTADSLSQKAIGSFPISVCCTRTSNLIFSYAIKSVDRGSKDLLVQKARGMENVLQLKAARENFDTTNLSVITSDGRFFSFTVSYAMNPEPMNISFSPDSSGQAVQVSGEMVNSARLEHDAAVILRQKHFLHYHVFSEGIKLRLQSIYIKDNMLWFSCEVRNLSFLDYHPDYLRCFIQDKTKAARMALQEKEVRVIYPERSLPEVPGKKKNSFVLAFLPFSFSKDKKMILQMSEPNGARALMLSIPNKAILQATLVNNK